MRSGEDAPDDVMVEVGYRSCGCWKNRAWERWNVEIMSLLPSTAASECARNELAHVADLYSGC